MKYINTYNQHNEGIGSGLAKVGLIGTLLASSPAISSTRNSFDIDGVVYNQVDKLREIQKNVTELSNLRKGKSRDQKLSSILSEIQHNLTNIDSTRFTELFDELSKHLESKYGYKIPDKKVEELTDAGVSELKNGNDGITFISIIGWLGSICLAICGLPQAWASHKDKHSHGISWAFLLLWAFGELFALTYVYDKLDLPLLLNYSINILILSVILYYKAKPKSKDLIESKIFENIDENDVIQTIKDICLDLEDDGFKVDIYTSSGINHSGSEIMIYKGNAWDSENDHKFDDVSDTIDRLHRFLGNNFIDAYFLIRNNETIGFNRPVGSAAGGQRLGIPTPSYSSTKWVKYAKHNSRFRYIKQTKILFNI